MDYKDISYKMEYYAATGMTNYTNGHNLNRTGGYYVQGSKPEEQQTQDAIIYICIQNELTG